MHRVHHTIRLIGRIAYGSEAPPIPVGNMLRLIEPAVRQSILMGFLGRSRPPGRPPAWLVSASDVRFVGIDGGREGETILHFEAPRLGESADELYRQQEFWPSRPPAEDTGFDLLCDILGDVSAHKRTAIDLTPPCSSGSADSVERSTATTRGRFSWGIVTPKSTPLFSMRSRSRMPSNSRWRPPGRNGSGWSASST